MADALLPLHRQASSSSQPPARSVELARSDGDEIPVRSDITFVESPPMKVEASAETSAPPVVELQNVERPPDGCFGRLPRLTWLFSAYILTGLVAVTWLVYGCVRYTRAVEVYQGHPLRYRDTIAFATLSFLALGIIVLNLCVVSMGVKLSMRSHAVVQCLLFVASVSAIVPAAFNVAAICLFHARTATRDPYLSLAGRCTIDSDVVWSGVSEGCSETVSWGAWLAVALVRLVVTVVFLVAFHWLTWTQVLDPDWGTPARVSLSTASLVPSPAAGKLRKRRPESLRTAPDSSSSLNDHRRTFSSSVHHQSATTLTYFPHHLLRPSVSTTPGLSSPPARPLVYDLNQDDPQFEPRAYESLPRLLLSDLSEHSMEVDDAGDLNRFAASFRSLVERVSRETEAASVLAYPESPTSPASSSRPPRRSYSPPPRRSFSPASMSSSASASVSLHRSNSVPTSARRMSVGVDPGLSFDYGEAERLRRQLLTAHEIMLMEQADRIQSYEHVIVLGNAVRRMSTIPSLPDADREPWTPLSQTPTFGGGGVTRSPTASSARSAGWRNGGARQNTNGTGTTHGSTPTPPPPPAVEVDPPPDPAGVDRVGAAGHNVD